MFDVAGTDLSQRDIFRIFSVFHEHKRKLYAVTANYRSRVDYSDKKNDGAEERSYRKQWSDRTFLFL